MEEGFEVGHVVQNAGAYLGIARALSLSFWSFKEARAEEFTVPKVLLYSDARKPTSPASRQSFWKPISVSSMARLRRSDCAPRR